MRFAQDDVTDGRHDKLRSGFVCCVFLQECLLAHSNVLRGGSGLALVQFEARAEVRLAVGP